MIGPRRRRGRTSSRQRYSRSVSPRTRVLAVVAFVAAAAAGTAVGGALFQDRAGRVGGEAHEAQTTTQASEPPVLELALLDRDDEEARLLARAERLYETGRKEQARRRFQAILRRNPQSLRAAVGAAITAWPNGSIERLQALVERHPESGVARLNLGLALLALGETDAARKQWREAEKRDSDSPAALRAEDLLHPEFAPGRPPFVAELEIPAEFARAVARGAAEPREDAERRGRADDPSGYLLLGAVLQRLGRPVSARRAFARAEALVPESLDARTAAAVALFDKDDPSAAFSRLGPLAREHPRAPVVRFHLGLMLLWIGQADEARRQLELTGRADPKGFYARQATRVLARLDAAG